MFDYQTIFHSDTAVRNLLAQEIIETGRYFPPEWNYANGDLWVLFTHTFVLPFLPLLPNGFGLHILSDLITAALIVAGGGLFIKLLDVSGTARLAALCVLTAGISILMAEHVYGQGAYGSMFYSGAFLLFCYWRTLYEDSRPLAWAGATLLIALLLFWSNPLRAAVMYALPLLAAAVTVARLPAARAYRHWRAALAFAAGSAVGVLLHIVTLKTVQNLPSPPLQWLDFDGMLHSVKVVLEGLLLLFDGTPRWDSTVTSPLGAYRLLRLLAALALLWLMPRALGRLLRSEHPARLYCAVFTATAAALPLLLLLTTTLADMGSPDGAVRYLVPSLLCMLLIFAALAVDGLHLSSRERIACLAVVTALASSAAIAYTFPYRLFFLQPPALKLPTQAARLVAFLQQNGLRYGYSTFWNAGKLTVLSAHGVRIRQVNFEHGLPMPMRKLSSNRWYDPDYFHGETFLLLQDNELQSADLPLLAQRLGEPVRTLRFEDWTVIVYRRNIAELSEWDRGARQPIDYAVTEHTPHQLGTFDGTRLVAPPGAAGALHFGPFRVLVPGSYVVTFDIDTSGDGAAGFGTVDVTASGGTRTLARQEITATGPHRIALRVDTTTVLGAVEFRVFTNGKGRIAISNVRLERARAP